MVQLLPGGESDVRSLAWNGSRQITPMSQVFVDDVQPQVLQKFFRASRRKLISEVPVSYSCDCRGALCRLGLGHSGTGGPNCRGRTCRNGVPLLQ